MVKTIPINKSISDFAKEINDTIISIIEYDKDCSSIRWGSNNELSQYTEYDIDYESIESLFSHCPISVCPNKLTKRLIYNRLAVIDNLYETNIVRMRRFGIADLTDSIWQLCDNGYGNHTDFELTKKAENFVLTYSTTLYNNKPTNHIINAFTTGYGVFINSNNKVTHSKAPSIISKYLYFLLQTNHTNNIGFPIYDSLVCKIAPKIAQKLGVIHYGCCTDIWKYTFMLSEIIRVLEAQNPSLWNKQNPRKTKFALLDHFLWRIGKVKTNSFSLLLTKSELISYLNSGKTNLPNRIMQIQLFINNNNI